MQTRGFTLVELLVVIAIIAALSSAVLVSLAGTQAKARDTRRLEDMASLQKALQLYLISHGHYPIQTSTTLTGTDPVMSALIADGVIPSTPTDPSAPITQYSYVSNEIGNDYSLGFCLETNDMEGRASGCGNSLTP